MEAAFIAMNSQEASVFDGIFEENDCDVKARLWVGRHSNVVYDHEPENPNRYTVHFTLSLSAIKFKYISWLLSCRKTDIAYLERSLKKDMNVEA